MRFLETALEIGWICLRRGGLRLWWLARGERLRYGSATAPGNGGTGVLLPDVEFRIIFHKVQAQCSQKHTQPP